MSHPNPALSATLLDAPESPLSATLLEYCRQLADYLGKIDLRALPGLGASPTAIELGLAEAMVLPELVAVHTEGAARALGDVLAREPRAMIQGEPGAGKTTLLRCLCLTFADAQSGLLQRISTGRKPDPDAPELPEGLVPVLLPLANFRPARARGHELTKWMTKLLADDHGETCAGAVMAAVGDGRGLVCLDGLDEIGHEGMRQRVAQVIEDWAARIGGICWVTARTHGALILRGFSPHAVQPFGYMQLREYLIRREWARGTDLDAAKRSAEATLRRLGERPETLAMLRHPLLLVMALASEDSGLRLPTQRTSLYKGVIDVLVKAWNRVRRPEDALKRATGATIDPEALRRALAAAALGFHEDGVLGQPLHHEVWTRALARHLGGGDRGEEYAEGVIEVLVEQAGLLVREGSGLLRFWHASLGEYLAATALARVARDRPQRIVRSTGSIQGREVTCMAIACARIGDGPSPEAARLFAVLLAPDSGGPWTRLFGEPVRVAVDCLRDGHPLDAAGFSRLLARVLDLVERAPIWANAETLGALARPPLTFTPAVAEQLRLIGLLRAEPPLLPGHVTEPLTRWIAGATTVSEDARAYCAHVLATDRTTEKLWAAFGLLRAGVVRADACRVVAEFLDRQPQTQEEPRMAVVLRAIDGRPAAPANVPSPGPGMDRTRRAALRELLLVAPDVAAPGSRSRVDTDAEKARVAAATLLAVLGEDDDAVIAALAEGGLGDRPFKTACRCALAWVATTSEAARQWLAGALLAEEAAARELAEAVLKDMLQTPLRSEAAAEAVFLALGGAEGKLPDVRALLADRGNAHFGRNERTFHDVLRSFAWSDRDGLAALARRCRDPTAGSFHARWVLTIVLWDQVHRREEPGPAQLAACLFEGVASEDLAVAVTSACRLAYAWERLDSGQQRSLGSTWVRGLRCPGERVLDLSGRLGKRNSWGSAWDEPVNAVCLAAWTALKDLVPRFDAAMRAELCAALASEHPLQQLIAACVLRSDRLVGARCEQLLVQALHSEDLQLASVALRGLETGAADPARTELLIVAEIRLALSGWLGPVHGRDPPTREMLETFLAAPCTITFGSWGQHAMAHHMLRWLAQHPNAGALADAGLLAPDRSRVERAALLLATWSHTPGRITEVTAKLIRGGPQLRGVMAMALHEVITHNRDGAEDGEDSPRRKAAKWMLGDLLRDRLRSEDIGEVHAAVRKLWWHSISVDELPAAWRRLLKGPVLAWRVEEVHRWLSVHSPPELAEVAALRWFGVGLAELAAALRPCADDADDMLAIEAGLLLAYLCAEAEPLRSVARRILTAPARVPEDEDIDRQYDCFHRLRTEAARELFHVTMHARPLPGAWRLAIVSLVDIEDDGVLPTLRELIVGPDGLIDGWYLYGLPNWLARYRPRWWAALEPDVAADLACGRPHHVRNVVGWLRQSSGMTAGLLSALATRWSEWLYVDMIDRQSDFAAFTGGDEAPPDEIRAGWWRDLDAREPATRGRAALALAHCGEHGDAIVDALIAIFLQGKGPAAGRAWDRLGQPEYADSFARRRRAQRWRSSGEAWDLLALWSANEVEGDREVVVPLLHASMQSADDRLACWAALDLWALDRGAATATLQAMSGRSTDAAVFLLHQADPTGEARLWWALGHAEEDRAWEGAAIVLYRRDPRDPRLLDALARISARKALPQAIWLLHEISREAALSAILERIASNRGSGSLDLSDLSAMIHGMRPGQPPAMLLGGCWSDFSVSLREADEDPAYQSTIDDQLPSSLRYAPTLDSLAAGLIQLEREIPANALGLPAAMASMLAGDVTRWTALWERARAGEACSAAEIEEIRMVVDLRLEDRPGQRLARLWWRLQLPATALLEQEERAAVDIDIKGPQVSEEQHLARLLGAAFPDESALRGFVTGFDLADELGGATLTELRHAAATLFVHRGWQDEAVRRLVESGALREGARATWERRKCVNP